jgi:CrcB protein
LTALLVVLGAMAGAPMRYLTDLYVQSRHRSAFPWGTFVVNASGSLALGALAGAVASAGGPSWALTLLGAGFCGAFTTFSTFGFETVRLVEQGQLGAATLNVVGSVAVGLGCCAAGFAAASALFR